MSAFVYAGSAQFAAVAILGQGGSVLAAVLAAVLMNARYIAMGVAIGPSLKGGRVRRGAGGPGGRRRVVGAGQPRRGALRPPHALRLVGAAVRDVAERGRSSASSPGGVLPDPEALGIDAVFPAFFLALLVGELKRPPRRARWPSAARSSRSCSACWRPAGVGILAASAVALVGLRDAAAEARA